MKNNEGCCGIRPRTLATVFGVLGAFLIFAGLAWVLRHYTQAKPIGNNRAEERLKTRQEMSAASVQALGGYAWVNQQKGYAQIPIERAMQLTIQDYKNPDSARSNMVKKIEDLTAPPPKAPEKPSEFE